MRLLRQIAIGTMAVMACASVAAGTAQASPRSAVASVTASKVTVHEVKVPMKLEGFNAAVAKRNGYSILKNAEGQQYAVKLNAKGQEIASTATPDASVCGDSYIEYDAIGNKQAIVFSGWSLDDGYTADFFTWDIIAVDSAGTGSKNFYGNPTQQGGTPTNWYIPTGWLTTHSVTGSSYAEVTAGQILLTNGGVCDAPLPIVDYTTLY